MLLLCCIPLPFKKKQKKYITVLGLTEGGSCFGSYIVYHYCFRFDRGMTYVVVVLI